MKIPSVLGVRLRRPLPEDHLTAETKEAVKPSRSLPSRTGERLANALQRQAFGLVVEGLL
jgi:hypothetical protein